MAENKLGIGYISFPLDIDKDLLLSLEDFVRRVDDNVNYLLRPSIVTVTNDYTATDLDYTIIANGGAGGMSVHLPAVDTVEGKIFIVKKINAIGTVTITTNGSETIDGSATSSLTTQYQSVMLQSDGSNWHILSSL